MGVLLSLVLVRVAAACEGGEGVEALHAELDVADQALASLDRPAFDAAVDRARSLVPCVWVPIDPPLAARLHRLVGVRAFGARDPLAQWAFAAARRAADEGLPEALFPVGTPIDEVFHAVALAGIVSAPLASPQTGWITLDGTASLDRIPEFPVVFQRFTDAGEVVSADYVFPGMPVPSYPRLVDLRTGGPLSERFRVPLIATATASGALSVFTFGLSARGRARFNDLDNPVADESLDGLRSRTNVLAASSLVGVSLCAASSTLLAARW